MYILIKVFIGVTMSDIESQMLKQGLIKVPMDDKNRKESPYKRVAKFLFIIGTDQAAEVLKQLSKEQVDKVVAELVTVRSVDKKEALEILTEFNEIYNSNKNLTGGIETAKAMLTEAFGSKKAAEILENTVPAQRPVPFDYLDGMDTERLTRVLAGELPASKAVVLSQLKPKQAADYIGSLGDEEKKDIVLRLAKMKEMDASILQLISDALKKKVVDVNLNRSNAIDGVSVLADILRKIDYESGSTILSALELEDGALAESIKSKLLTLDDIANMHPKHIQHLISPMTDTQIALLIHGKEPKFRSAVLDNISKNRAEAVLEEENYLRPISKKDVKEACENFLNRAKIEADKGTIILIKNDEDRLVF